MSHLFGWYDDICSMLDVKRSGDRDQRGPTSGRLAGQRTCARRNSLRNLVDRRLQCQNP
jgi:hypothetical protein